MIGVKGIPSYSIRSKAVHKDVFYRNFAFGMGYGRHTAGIQQAYGRHTADIKVKYSLNEVKFCRFICITE